MLQIVIVTSLTCVIHKKNCNVRISDMSTRLSDGQLCFCHKQVLHFSLDKQILQFPNGELLFKDE